ncbi:hypothetical protein AR1Y2_0324 [Anaerostipes rhamnosivorans]|uniref:Uncharacterized protein n=1 Tax=Anaerostipes rhamnosivorans TaxID=1229621 RepID=A0A4P8I8F7_9FIRM|nr:hypothetical protein AR1Y2_0324 [Anaerostipes rhamnosivorans]
MKKKNKYQVIMEKYSMTFSTRSPFRSWTASLKSCENLYV